MTPELRMRFADQIDRYLQANSEFTPSQMQGLRRWGDEQRAALERTGSLPTGALIYPPEGRPVGGKIAIVTKSYRSREYRDRKSKSKPSTGIKNKIAHQSSAYASTRRHHKEWAAACNRICHRMACGLAYGDRPFGASFISWRQTSTPFAGWDPLAGARPRPHTRPSSTCWVIRSRVTCAGNGTCGLGKGRSSGCGPSSACVRRTRRETRWSGSRTSYTTR